MSKNFCIDSAISYKNYVLVVDRSIAKNPLIKHQS